MRLKNSRIYILYISVIIIVLGLFATIYFNGLKANLENRASEASFYETLESFQSFEDKVNNYLSLVENKDDTLDYVLIKDELKPNLNNSYVISRSKDIEVLGSDDYYLYLGSNNNYAKVSLETFLPTPTENGYNAFVVSSTGIIAYSNTIQIPLYTLIEPSINQELSLMREKLSEGNNVFSIIKIDNKLYTISFIYLDETFSYVNIVLESDLELDLLKVNQILAIFIIALFSSILITGLIFYISFKGQNEIKFNEHVVPKNGIYVLKVNKYSDILTKTHDVRLPGVVDKKLKNLSTLETLDGKLVSEILGKEDVFTTRLNIDLKTRIIEFSSFNYKKYFILIGRDVTEFYAKVTSLENLTLKNKITTLPNYTVFQADYKNIINDAKNKGLTFILANMNEYQELLKLFGQAIMENLLKETAFRLKKSAFGGEVYQIENDIFLLYITDKTLVQTDEHVKRLISKMNHSYTVNDNTILVKFKYAIFDVEESLKSSLDSNELKKELDMTLERVLKLPNKNTLKYDINIKQYYEYRKQMQQDIVKALNDNEFVMYFQPQYSLTLDKVEGFEALLRWDNPKYKKTSPQEYVELAEQCGYITQLGNYCIKQVFQKAKLLEDKKVTIAINVSPAQIFQSGFTNFLIEEANKINLKKSMIALEITETFLMENFTLILEKLNILRKQGFKVHLDDFGTGYSSLQYIQELPIDTIKIDRAFIKSIETDQDSKSITKTIVSLAKSINVETIAEGVENLEQALILKQLGVTYIQGYYIDKALTFEDAVKKLNYKMKKRS